MKYTILNKKKNRRYFLAFILGVISMVWQIKIYRQTIIDLHIPILIIVIMGTICFVFDRQNYASTYKISYLNIWAWLQNTMSWGFLACTIFIASNKYFANDIIQTTTHQINSTGTMIGKPHTKENEKPLIRIDYYGKTKELVFSSEYLKKMNTASSVTIITRNGLFGYRIIDNQTLNE